MNDGDMSFTADSQVDQLAIGSTHDFRNPAIVATAATQVATAQEQLDALAEQAAHSNDQRKVSA